MAVEEDSVVMVLVTMVAVIDNLPSPKQFLFFKAIFLSFFFLLFFFPSVLFVRVYFMFSGPTRRSPFLFSYDPPLL